VLPRAEPAGTGEPALQPTRARECWRFTIADTGVGMDTDDVARLFQPFEQARQGRPTEPGTGLGLAITQRLVRLLGGDLQVESSPGRGTTFSFALALPAVDAPRPASRSPFPVTGYTGPRRRIAVVDDHAINRSLLRDLLEPLGFEIVEFESAEAMLAVAPGALGADLAFLDVKLPGINGLELARHLRERADTCALPIVFTSASVLTFDHATAAALGCPDFLPKPFAEAQLNELLTRLLDLRWERAGAPAAAAVSAAPLPSTLIDELFALAESGDIAALRGAVSAALQAHPGHVTLKQVETAAASYQLEAVRQLLRTAPTA
jgi:CheY-like chemotaxis protein